jgi:metal-responsive CopG/Arc/MetJ family transcriptional regulator
MSPDETFSQRMPEELAAELDAFVQDVGMTRNGAINLLVARGLREAGYRDAPGEDRTAPRRRPRLDPDRRRGGQGKR